MSCMLVVYEYTYIHNLDGGPVLTVVGTRYTKRITITAVLPLVYCTATSVVGTWYTRSKTDIFIYH